MRSRYRDLFLYVYISSLLFFLYFATYNFELVHDEIGVVGVESSIQVQMDKDPAP